LFFVYFLDAVALYCSTCYTYANAAAFAITTFAAHCTMVFPMLCQLMLLVVVIAITISSS